jgi:hypothetical protein
VSAAGATTWLPFAGGSVINSLIFAEGYQLAAGEAAISPRFVYVTPGYLEAMRVQLVAGRFIDERDVAASAPVVVVDDRLARRFWPGQDPVGRRMYRAVGHQQSSGDHR